MLTHTSKYQVICTAPCVSSDLSR